MSRSALAIIWAKTFKQLAAYVVMVFIIRLPDWDALASELLHHILAGLGVWIAFSFLWALAIYMTQKFYIKDGNLVFMHGIFNRENTVIPLDRIHSLRTKKGIWYRILDMRGIVFDTLATRREEIELILSESDWQRLISLIETEERPKPTSPELPPEYNPASAVRYSNTNLILAALCQNHFKGMTVLGSFLMFILGNLSDLSDRTLYTIADFVEASLDPSALSFISAIVFLAAVYLVILILWLGRVLLKYYDMTLRYDRRLLSFSYGLFTRESCRFFYDKICTIRIKRNPLEKKFGFSTIMLRQALNASALKEEDNIRIYAPDASSFYLNWWLGEGYLGEEKIMSAQSGRGVMLRHLLPGAVLAIAVAIALWYFDFYGWLVVPFLYLCFLIPNSVCRMRNSRIDLQPGYLTIRSGGFSKTSDFLKYSNVEVVRLRRTPLSRWTGRVSLALSTSGSTLIIRSLRKEEAHKVYEEILRRQF